jgi:hypothetical protein
MGFHLVDFDIDDALKVLNEVVKIIFNEQLRNTFILLLHVVKSIDVCSNVPLERPTTIGLR